MLVLPFILPFVPDDKETLPEAFRWFDNAEIPLKLGAQDDGLAGPKYYRVPYLNSLPSFIPYSVRLFIVRYTWLALRNPINYFQHKTLGFHIEDSPISATITEEYNPKVGNKTGDVSGSSYLEVTYRGKIYWELYIVRQYKFLKDKCFRARIGYAIDKPSECTPGSYKRWVFTVTPFMKYEGVDTSDL
jgi:hypothetical protein